MNDFDSFIKATYLLEDLWKSSGIDYEDTPQEIYHLGEESLNALDSVLGFQSLRTKYDLNEYYNHDWADTASLYVEDDDYQIALNQNHEIKIGSKFYKFIFNSIVAIVNNNNTAALDSVRLYGIFAVNADILYYNEETGLYEDPSKQEGTGGTQSCSNFNPRSFATPHYSLSQNWVDLATFLQYTSPLSGYPQNYRSVKGYYTIDWGDGVVESFTGYLIEVNYFKHIYQWPVTGSVVKNITVRCQLIPQSNPTNGYNLLIQDCPDLLNIIWTITTTVKLDSFNYPDCMNNSIRREFMGIERTVNGTRYRLECKIKKSKNPVFWSPSIKATAKFTKLKNNKWKNTKSLNDMILTVRGSVFRTYDCNQSWLEINRTVIKSRKNKIKNRHSNLIYGVYTKRNLPSAINVDFIWKYNNNQSQVSNFNELLNP